jgi:Protein of unknown function (DUF1569)
MKSLTNPSDTAEILRRIASLRPDSERRWGRMSAHQMICHLTDGFKMYIGEKEVGPDPRWYPQGLLRWIALWAPVPWPKGFRTAPELDQEGSGTPPAQFEADVRELRSMIECFCRIPNNFVWPQHPRLGKMSRRDWMRLGYLHSDHHLRQFGA